MINNVNIFTMYESLLQNVINLLRQFTEIKRKFREKIASSGLNKNKR